MKVPEGWKDRDAFEVWWYKHGRQFRALSVKDPALWEKIAAKVEAFQVANRGY